MLEGSLSAYTNSTNLHAHRDFLTDAIVLQQISSPLFVYLMWLKPNPFNQPGKRRPAFRPSLL
jgi:hypothetical protein